MANAVPYPLSAAARSSIAGARAGRALGESRAALDVSGWLPRRAQACPGALWEMLEIRGEEWRQVERRLLALAERAFAADGYDTGVAELDLGALADRVDDPSSARGLRLRHAYLSYATESEDEGRRTRLADALDAAKKAGLDVDALRAECLAIIGGWRVDELPTDATTLRGR